MFSFCHTFNNCAETTFKGLHANSEQSFLDKWCAYGSVTPFHKLFTENFLHINLGNN